MPLTGLRVIELARILAGPWIGQTLADLGADVVKVESPQGDETRNWGPPFIGDSAAYFHAANRGKRGMTCDFRNPAQLAALKAEIARADVVIENFKRGDLARYGLDYQSLAVDNPGLIHASVTGFGQDGPKADLPGYDLLIQGASGIMDLTGDPDGPPQKVGVAWIDIITGLYGVIAVQAALAERSRSGLGQQIDLSLMDCAVAALANQAMNALAGAAPRRMGNAHPNIVPYQVFPASDGHIIIACGSDRQFAALAQALGDPTLAADPAYATNAQRVAARDTVVARISVLTAPLTRAEITARLQAAGVPGGPINSVAEALADPQVQARGVVIAPEGTPGIRTPIRFSRSRLHLSRAAPRR
ncbi:MAG: CoA transferase [Paracoccus sp. (in: a-proteobacteria)]|uniref:CaiB/BaiF CoA transferase family protein n=1 Tax=Paracoccus sp. TaxID=267 RepID=UPI0026DF14D7|nr:CoA transferase [Paracoccus sp. (in: a-proteobacteria)]MDO5620209.1 CoA transferase [Paracoccus sp. (in: a-proteobacteria)]